MTQQSEAKFSGGDLQDEGYAPKEYGKYSFSGNEKNHFFLNTSKNNSDGSQRQFFDASAVSGLDSSADGRAFAVLDFDRDGDQDIALVNANTPSFQLFRNNTKESKTAGNFVAVRLVGGAKPDAREGWSNRSAIGTTVIAHHGSRHTVRTLSAGEGFGAQNSSVLMIGIDKSTKTDLEVRWPSGRSQRVTDIEAGSRVDVYENPADNIGEVVRLSQYSNFDEARATLVCDGMCIMPAATGGQTATSSSLNKVSEELPKLSDKGITLLVTMATWCDSCKKAIPALRNLESELQSSQSNRMIGVPIDSEDDDEKLRQYAETHNPPYAIFAERSPELVHEIREIILGSVRVAGLPTTVIIGPDRTVLDVISGVPTLSDIRRLTSANLAGGLE